MTCQVCQKPMVVRWYLRGVDLLWIWVHREDTYPDDVRLQATVFPTTLYQG